MAQGSAAPLLPSSQLTADITTMLIEHPKGAAALLVILENMKTASQNNYDKAAYAMAMQGELTGLPAFHLGSVKNSEVVIDALHKLQQGKPI